MVLRDETIEWLEKKSDKNLLEQFKYRLDKLPSNKKFELETKGYITRDGYTGKLYLTDEGEILVKDPVEPPYPLL
ncbi:MAG: hypothetical protein GWN64_12325 [Candidatus Thorarchaeota archaeon]|nr:hypothetical protein [Candidatus Thorarchaeota archaeon]